MPFTAFLVTDHVMVEVLMICASVITLIPITVQAPTLAAHTNLQHAEYIYGTRQTQSLLAGSLNFTPNEVEIYFG